MTTKGIKRPKPFTLRHPRLKLGKKMRILPLDKDGKVIGYADENGTSYPVIETDVSPEHIIRSHYPKKDK